MKEILFLLNLIIKRINRIYAHLDIDWDSYSEAELINKYEKMGLIIEGIEDQNKSTREDV